MCNPRSYRDVSVHFAPFSGGFQGVRNCAVREGTLFGRLIRLNVAYLYPRQVRIVIGDLARALLAELRRDPLAGELDEWPILDLEANPIEEVD